MLISLCVVAYNEQEYIGELLENIKNQDYSKEKTEIILVNNGSNDNTFKIMEDFAKNNIFYGVKVLSIERNNLAFACNEAIKAMSGDIYVRVDAHAKIADDFLSSIVSCMESGEKVCGGSRVCIPAEDNKLQDMLLQAESSLFGSSFADYRREHEEKKYMSSLFHIAIKKEVLKDVGGYNENLGRTEDNEMTYRLRKHGYKLCFDPKIKSYQIIRSSLKKMLFQKYSNGYWIGLTMGICSKCISLFHFAPLCLVLGIIFSLILCLFTPWILIILLGVYLLFDLTVTVSVFYKEKKFNPYYLFLPFVFILLHLGYGIGTLYGLVEMPFRIKHKISDKNKGVFETKEFIK